MMGSGFHIHRFHSGCREQDTAPIHLFTFTFRSGMLFFRRMC